jgi:hypothetical protein
MELMPKDAFWFPHDANARNDPAICAMRKKYKAEGYGYFWMMVEMMREQSDYKLKHAVIDGYAMQMQSTSSKVQCFINDCVACGLFHSDGVVFWSQRLLREMNYKMEVSEKRRGAAKAMHERRQLSTCSASAEQMQSKCMPEHNNTEQYSTEQENVPPVVSKDTTSPKGDALFELFWKQYPRHEAKQPALTKWRQFKVDDAKFAEIMAGLDRSKQSRQWKDGFIPHARTWLNQRRWEDETTEETQGVSLYEQL